MNNAMLLGIVAIGVIAVIAAVLALDPSRQKKRLAAISTQITDLYERIASLEAFESGYLMKKDWDALLESSAQVRKAIQKTPKKTIESSPLAEQIAFIEERCQNHAFREERNERYKTHELELCDAMLSNIDGGKSLDPQQRDAIITDEYSNLVIAGAGSGKTSVVVGKVKYLVERWGVDPADILVTSFTRASVEDLKSRIELSGVTGVSALTFHSIGRHILGSVSVAPENALQKHVTSYLSNELASIPDQATAFLEFFGLRNLVPSDSPDSREAGTRMKILKAQDMRTLKSLVKESGLDGGMETLLGERVRSIEELMIANFLFLNCVEYEYEKPYPNPIPEELRDESRRAYQPDFYLVDYDIWLEHFGIDENNRVPWMRTSVEEQSYLDGIKWKRQVHERCETKLIESYSFWNRDQNLLNKVEELLTSNGVVLKRDPERNAAVCVSLLQDQRLFNSMTRLVSTFISLVKSNNKTEAEVDDTAREAYRGDGAMWRRYEQFTQFTWPIMESYQKALVEGPVPTVDFDDMINKAATRVREDGFEGSYRYIIVDEYQDISLSRFGLLKAIRDATGAKLMCVGDDWQAIYRFAGSDVTLFTNFGKLVGPYEEMRIEHTYRNSQKLVDAASGFVLKNPDQLRKSVVSMAPAQSRPPIAIASNSNQSDAFTFALNDLVSSPGGGGEIIVLGRNRRDLEKIFPNYAPTDAFSFRNPKRNDASEEKFEKVIVYSPSGAMKREIGFMTVHKSKGLQADNVIVIGLVNTLGGFPNMIEDDPMLELLLADSDRYDFAEERRLFYVALTRTKNRVWLVTGDEFGYPGISIFIDELHRDCDKDTLELYSHRDSEEPAKCPRCGGALIKRTGPNGREFVGCSNYPFCDKSYGDIRVIEDKKRCPRCGGWLTRRVRKDGSGEFFGCTNYPRYCYYTMNLDGTGGKSEKVVQNPHSGANYSYASISLERATEDNSASARHGKTRPRCPKCGVPMVLRKSKYGKFYGCPNYPSCTETKSYPSA